MNKKDYHLDLPAGVSGPESIAFDCRGRGPYVGVADGRILKWQGHNVGWIEFATTKPDRNPLCNGPHLQPSHESYCGRPLGLKFHPKTCELYIADAYSGLMKVGQHGGVAEPVVTSANGVPLRFTNGLDIDPSTGIVYFTDTSTVNPRWAWQNIITGRDRTGRLISYNPRNNIVSVLMNHLAFPNGVSLSKDGSFLLFGETSTGQVHKYWLWGPKQHTSELFVQLGGRPDNISRNKDGDFWIAQNPTLPFPLAVRTIDRGRPMKMNSSGRILEILNDTGSTSDVTEFGNKLWLGSVSNSYVGIRQH